MIATAQVNRTIFLIDEDVAECSTLSVFLEASGYNVRTYNSAESFLEEVEHTTVGIILLELRMTRMSGLELQAELTNRGIFLPIIFISGHGSVQMSVKAFKGGAIDFLEKPLNNVELLKSIREAFSLADGNKVHRHADTIKSLIAHCEDINAINKRGHAPIHLGTAKGNSDEEIFRAITNVDDLIAVLDTDGRRIYNSPSYRKIFRKEELGAGSSSFDEIHPEDRERIKAVFRRTVETGIGERSEFRFLLKDGSIRFIESQGNVVHGASGKASKVVVVSRDVTERKNIEEKLRHLSYHDLLTGLPNRILFDDRLKQAIAAAKRDKIHKLSLMYMDLDNFKKINDSFGHAAGDLVLKEVASRIQDCLRESDTAARMGGDEFVVLLPGIEAPDDAMIVAKKIRHALCQPIDLGKHGLTVTTSIGIADYPEHGSEEEALLKNADAAMYHAKESGRDTVCIFSPVQQQSDE